MDNVQAEEAALDSALATVEDAACDVWKESAWMVLVNLAMRGNEFTTDAVWLMLSEWRIPPPREPRAMGAMVRRAVRVGLIEGTGRMVKSERVGCHRRPVVVYRPRPR